MAKKKIADALVTEVPLAIFINAEPLTVTMQTQGNEMELTRGLLFTEGIFKKKSGRFPYKVLEKNDAGHIVKVSVVIEGIEISAVNKRSLLSVSACGVCGKKELTFPQGTIEEKEKVLMPQLDQMFAVMHTHQHVFHATGGSHAAAAFDRNGQLLSVMEDIGRHNAVDKVVGDLLMKEQLPQASVLLVSGRISYEIVAKVFAAGIPILAAVSSPSSLAVDFAKELGITLIGFCRENRATVYAHPQRVT